MTQRVFVILALLISLSLSATAQKLTLSGKVTASANARPIAYATLFISQFELWAVTNEKGEFTIRQVPAGKVWVDVQCLGYVKKRVEVNVRAGMPALQLTLAEDNLTLNEVTVVAQKKSDALSTSYTLDRTTLDHAQVLNVSNISSLLPGGKVRNATLLSDTRIALHGGSQEKGNPSFGTAVEVDGVRLQSNAEVGETLGADTRSIATANIEQVEVISGIPSVEYGDLSNGIVKISTRKGKSPLTVDLTANPHTKQAAVNKGVSLGSGAGVLNMGFEHVRSVGSLSSPYTHYTRNAFNAGYANTLFPHTTPLSLSLTLAGNLGGYNSKSDPDLFINVYYKSRDYGMRGNLKAEWLVNRSWLTSLSLTASATLADKRTEQNEHKSSSSSQSYVHAMQEGYAIATEYDPANPNAPIILGPTGYWYEKSYTDSKPVTYAAKLKAVWAHRLGAANHRLMAGGEWTSSGNEGRGTYYEDMRHAPTWRPYRYDEQPYVNTLAAYVEERVKLPVASASELEFTAGLRAENTRIARSAYKAVTALSPRFNARYRIIRNGAGTVSDLVLYGGWGKAVKLPSAQILYPQPSYADRLAFTSASSADGKAFYAYYTYPVSPVYNTDLKWQYTRQLELGIEATVSGTKISLSAFHQQTRRPYMRVASYVPFSYKLTQQSDLEKAAIPFARQTYTIDPQTGVVTVHDSEGILASEQLSYTNREVFRGISTYTNGSPVQRSGIEWIVDFAPIKALRTSFRIDGNYYHYKGVEKTLIAWTPGSTSLMGDGRPYRYIGYYAGSDSYGTSSSAGATVANGSLSHTVNTNLTMKTHIPKLRLVFSLRVESSLYRYSRPLSEYAGGARSVVLDKAGEVFGTPYTAGVRDKYVATYPLYYSTWDEPDQKIPFYEKLLWAKDNDTPLYNELVKLVRRTNYAYVFNPERISSYFSANFSVTKEIGDFASLSFYANNFFNQMGRVKSARTGLEQTLYGSGYIPSFYYGLSLRLKL